MVIKMDHRVFRFATRGHCIKGKQCYHIAIWSPKLISVLNLFSSNLWSCLLREDVAAICQFIFGYFGEMRRMRVTSPTYKIEKKHSAHLSLLLVDQNLEFETSFVAKMVSLLASRSAQAQRLAWAQTNMRGHVICSTSTWSTFKTLFYTK